MASKFYELLAQVKKLAKITTTDADTDILRVMNRIQWDIYNANIEGWKALEGSVDIDTTDGTNYITLTSTVARVYNVRQADTSPYSILTYYPPQEFHSRHPQPTDSAEGKPTEYTVWGRTLYLFPIPDDTYALTIFGYLKPVNMKLYSTGTAAHSTLTVTGTSTFFSNNANVDTAMFYAYQADVRSDGTYPWSTITAVTNATAMTISAYTGSSGSSTVAYACSSASSFTEDFDNLLIYGTCIELAGRFRELKEMGSWLQNQYNAQFMQLLETNKAQSDFYPTLEDFNSTGKNIIDPGVAYLYPFVRSN